MRHGQMRQRHESLRTVVSRNLEGDVVAAMIRVEPDEPPLLLYNPRLVTADRYARALAWAETTAVTSSAPLSILMLKDL